MDTWKSIKRRKEGCGVWGDCPTRALPPASSAGPTPQVQTRAVCKSCNVVELSMCERGGSCRIARAVPIDLSSDVSVSDVSVLLTVGGKLETGTYSAKEQRSKHVAS